MKTTRARPCPEATLTEWFSIGVLCWWTYLLLIPPHLFRTNLAFLGLSHQGTESAWALWTGSAAAGQNRVEGALAEAERVINPVPKSTCEPKGEPPTRDDDF